MTVAEGLGFTGLVFLVAAVVFAFVSDYNLGRGITHIPAWISFFLAIVSWIAAIWVGVLT